MDIFAWVTQLQKELRQQGQHRLAELIDDVPNYAVEEQYALLDAAVPEALALARALRHPWLEVFFRHWAASGHYRRGEGEALLNETVSLFEFAHREETERCPQSICVTQDLARAYEMLDGPGWAAERLALCDDTLQKITPKWNCFSCISREKADACLDMGQAEQALAIVEAAYTEMEANREIMSANEYEFKSVIQHHLGDYDAALATLDAIEQDKRIYDYDRSRQSRMNQRALILAKKGEIDAAFGLLRPFSEIIEGDYWTWSQALYHCAKADAKYNDWQQVAPLSQIMSYYRKVGTHWYNYQIAVQYTRLAIARQSSWAAARGLDHAEAAASHLRNPERVAAELAELRHTLAELSVPTAPVPIKELCAWIRADNETNQANPERDIALLQKAFQTAYAGNTELEHSEKAQLASFLASAYTACGEADLANDVLWQAITADPSNPHLASHLFSLLNEKQNTAGLARLAQIIQASQPAQAAWYLARQAAAENRWEAVEGHIQTLLAIDPSAQNARWLLANALFELGRYTEATTEYRDLARFAAASEKEEALADLAHYRRRALIAASAAQDWGQVRELCAEMEIQLDSSEGAVNEDWGIIRIQFTEKGDEIAYIAQRTGPVTARILQPSRTGYPQHCQAEVVFEPSPLLDEPEDPEEQEHFVQMYEVIREITPSTFGGSWIVDGVDPGETAIQTGVLALQAQGWVTWFFALDGYVLPDSYHPEADPVPGIYFTLAAPQSVKVETVESEVAKHFAPYDLCWPHLAQAANRDMERHTRCIERYGL